MHRSHIGLSVGSQVLLVAHDVHNLCQQIVARLRFVHLLLYAAFECHRQLAEEWGVHVGSLLCSPSCAFHLIGRLASAGDAHIVGRHHRLLGGKGHGELAVHLQVVRRLVRPQRDNNLVHVPLSAPCGIHGIGPSLFVVCADYQHRLWQQPRFCIKTFHHCFLCFINSVQQRYRNLLE